MDLITKIFDMDFAAMVPEMGRFVKDVRGLLVLALLAGPILLLTLGALYLYRPTPEANFKFGFRTYFGMGSQEAWQYSQRIAGLVFGALGAVLLVAMVVVLLCMIGKDLLRLAGTAVICLICQAVLVLAARLVVAILSGRYFDKNGDRRR